MLNKNGLRWYETEYTCSEKKLIYELTRELIPEDIGDKPKVRRINKADIFKIDSIHNLNTSLISYFVYSLPENVEHNKEILLNKVKETANSYLADINVLINHLK